MQLNSSVVSEQEQSVLGAMLCDNDIIPDVVTIIESAEYFNHNQHRLIYTAIVDLWNSNIIADISSVTAKLTNNNELDRVGGRTYLINLVTACGDPTNAEYYAKDVQTAYVRRELNRIGGKYKHKALQSVDDVSTLLDSNTQELFELQTKLIGAAGEDFNVTISKELGLIEKRERGELEGVKVGCGILDHKTTGFQKGDYIILAGRPSKGKTALMLNWVKKVASAGHRPLVFSLEMSQRQLATRLVCTESMVDGDRYRIGDYREGEKNRITDAANRLMKLPIIVRDKAGMTVLEMSAEARKLIMKRNIDIIFIDYLQLIAPPQKENRNAEVTAISLGIKNMAKSLNVPVVCLSQLSRKVEGRDSQRPQLADLRDSGSIEQDCDIALFIWHEPEEKDNGCDIKPHLDTAVPVYLILAKHRNGSIGDIPLNFNKSIGLFANREYTQ